METHMKNLYEKLYRVQAEVGEISKEKKNPFYSSAYFDINSLIGHLTPILQKNKLLLLQPVEDGCVVSKVIDVDSGECIASKMMLPDIQDPQKIGSAITYYRRYTLASLLALQAEDDDGNKASGKSAPTKPVLKPDTEMWVRGVHAVASGKVELKDIPVKYQISKKDLERLEAEAMEHAQ